MQLRLSTLLVAAAVFGAVAAIVEEAGEKRLVRGTGPGRNFAFREGEAPAKKADGQISNDIGYMGAGSNNRNYAFKREEAGEKRLVRGTGPGRNFAFREGEAPAKKADGQISNDIGYMGAGSNNRNYAFKRSQEAKA